MRRLWWALACVVAGLCAGAGFYAGFWLLMVRRFPLLAEMRAGCGMGGAAASAPAYATAAKCQAYFADLGTLLRVIATDCVITGLLAAFVLLVLRFRVYPPSASGGRGARA
jgi:hypothetical protein